MIEHLPKQTATRMEETTFAESSGNVYADLGFPDAEGMLAKAEVARLIGITIRHLGVSPAKAADVLGIARESLTTLLEGRFEGIPLERMLGFLVALGQDVEMTVRSKPDAHPAGRVTVVASP